MLADLFKVIPIVFLGQSTVMAGLYFISGRLMPVFFSGLYSSTSLTGRTIVASAIIFPLANFVCGYSYQKFSTAIVSPAMIAMMVLAQVIFAVLALGVRPSLWLFPAAAITMTGCAWVSLLLLQK